MPYFVPFLILDAPSFHIGWLNPKSGMKSDRKLLTFFRRQKKTMTISIRCLTKQGGKLKWGCPRLIFNGNEGRRSSKPVNGCRRRWLIFMKVSNIKFHSVTRMAAGKGGGPRVTSATIDETNTDVSRRASEQTGKEMRMTLRSNKLILLEHPANLSKKRSQKSGRLGDFCVRKSGRKEGKGERRASWKSADCGFNFLSISRVPEGFEGFSLSCSINSGYPCGRVILYLRYRKARDSPRVRTYIPVYMWNGWSRGLTKKGEKEGNSLKQTAPDEFRRGRESKSRFFHFCFYVDFALKYFHSRHNE